MGMVHPTKPIGRFYSTAEMQEVRGGRPHWQLAAISPGQWRRMIQRILFELFRRERIRRTAATVITQVLVSEGDPGMVHPTKPIGRFYSTAAMQEVRGGRPHWQLAEISPGQWRPVVASPHPLRIMEEEAIACLLQAGVVVIACGGGGIPVAWE